MSDEEIIALYFARDEQALAQTDAKYGPYCFSLANAILPSREDAEEALNDTYLKAWQTMPPKKPAVLRLFLAKITRNLAFSRWRNLTAQKRGGGEMQLLLDELAGQYHLKPTGNLLSFRTTRNLCDALGVEQFTQADVDAQPEISQEATQDGYTVQLKSVETDGYVVRILLGITAPEGTVLPDIQFSNWYSALTPTSGAVSGDGSTNGIMDDGDGKDNTADWLLIDSPIMADGSMPFIPGSTWELHLVDIVHSGWDSVNNRSYNDTLAEGEWLFSIHFDEQNGDYRELELLSQPVSAQASTCWRMDGTDVTDVLETFRVTSVKVRRMSIKLTSDAGENADFFHLYGASSYAVMKDGSRVEIMNSEFVEPIDLEKLDYILLADGTKLPAPGN